uniref:Uncharacterized protein n=1 Tax=Glossina pallidipes TaxID=7398 RepID=A0A1B0A3Z0_GLOPL
MPPPMFKNTFNFSMKWMRIEMRITATGNAVYVYCNHKNSIMCSKRLQMEKRCVHLCIFDKGCSAIIMGGVNKRWQTADIPALAVVGDNSRQRGKQQIKSQQKL